jgi:hypothetical protein
MGAATGELVGVMRVSALLGKRTRQARFAMQNDTRKTDIFCAGRATFGLKTSAPGASIRGLIEGEKGAIHVTGCPTS